MKRLAAIAKRLHDEATPSKNTDQKLEDGSTMEWVAHSEADVSWLLRRIDSLIQSGRVLAKDLNSRIDDARFSGQPIPVFDGLNDLKIAIHTAVDANDEGKPLSDAILEARGGDVPVKLRNGY